MVEMFGRKMICSGRCVGIYHRSGAMGVSSSHEVRGFLRHTATSTEGRYRPRSSPSGTTHVAVMLAHKAPHLVGDETRPPDYFEIEPFTAK